MKREPILDDVVAMVTGASRGAGKGIAVELGRARATVYVTGRSTRTAPSKDGVPGTIDETAEAVTAAGGRGIALRCDHTDDDQIEAAMKRVGEESGHLDLLVNNAWGGNELDIGFAPFWELSMGHWDGMFTAGVRAAIATSRAAVPLLRRGTDPLIVTTTFYDRGKYTGNLFYDLAKHALIRLASNMARDLEEARVRSVALSPGFMRTERVLAAFGVDEDSHATQEPLAMSESPAYVGRAVAALTADAHKLGDRNGQVLLVGELAHVYGFTDVDGTQPAPFRID
jgi:NAD(P)-dependent dehydrogenase (short-subunit alcohol dehydrogenase family)